MAGAVAAAVGQEVPCAVSRRPELELQLDQLSRQLGASTSVFALRFSPIVADSRQPASIAILRASFGKSYCTLSINHNFWERCAKITTANLPIFVNLYG